MARGQSESRCVASDSLQPHGLNSPGQNTGVGSLSLLQRIFPTQGSNPGLPHCGQILLPAEPQGKPKSAGVGSLSLLQRIFPTQESNGGLLHCRRILYRAIRGAQEKGKECPNLFLCSASLEFRRLGSNYLASLSFTFSFEI